MSVISRYIQSSSESNVKGYVPADNFNPGHPLLTREQIEAMIPRGTLLPSEKARQVGIDFDTSLQNSDHKQWIKKFNALNLNLDPSVVQELALFILLHKNGMTEYARARNASVFFPKEATGCCLSFDVTQNGEVLVHLRTKIKSPVEVNGGFKRGRLSWNPDTNEMLLTQTAYIRKRAITSIKNELEKVPELKRVNIRHFIPVISSTCYKAREWILDGVERVDYKYSLTTPFYPLGDLSKDRENFNVHEAIASTAIAIKELHDSGFLHLDLKPQNVLRTESGEVFLCDYGNVRELNHLDQLDLNLYFAPPEWMNAVIGTPSKPARELQKMDHGKRYDSYSFGLLIYLLRTGKKESDLPWAKNVENYVNYLNEGKEDLKLEEYQKIIRKKNNFFMQARPVLNELSGLLRSDPSQRMSIEQVVEITSRV